MNLAVMFGGKSAEHDISVITAVGLGGAIPEAKKIYVDERNRWWLVTKTLTPAQYKGKKIPPTFLPVTILPNNDRLYLKLGWIIIPICRLNAAVLCFHGNNGEDGATQGLLQLAGIPYTGSGIGASAIGMDKILSKKFFASLGLPVLKSFSVDIDGFLNGEPIMTGNMNFPLVVKPCSLGSSIGISVVKDANELEEALSTAFAFDSKVMIESALLDCHEANCSYFCKEVSEVYHPYSAGEILSFEDKYLSGEKAEPRKETLFINEIKRATKIICDSLNVQGAARVDFLVTEKEWFVNEINTIPGSLAYPMWKDRYSLREYVLKAVDQAVNIHKIRKSLKYAYESNVLNMGSSKK
ncbi:MAG TPA: hypothetical protein P5087_01315 [Eubacteriales bacterium]|nr:hypothetical protein [Eubacteriales bacterium]